MKLIKKTTAACVFGLASISANAGVINLNAVFTATDAYGGFASLIGIPIAATIAVDDSFGTNSSMSNNASLSFFFGGYDLGTDAWIRAGANTVISAVGGVGSAPAPFSYVDPDFDDAYFAMGDGTFALGSGTWLTVSPDYVRGGQNDTSWTLQYAGVGKAAGTFSIISRQDVSSISQQEVSAVPEPSVMAMMFGGLGLVGFMATRRKNLKI